MQRTLQMLALLFLLTACGPEAVAMPAPINTQAIFPTMPPAASAAATTVNDLPTQTPEASLEAGITPTATFVSPSLTPYADDQRFSIGQSVEGRDLWAWQFGEGPRTIVLVGGMHGGFEGNTVVLSEELVSYFRLHPAEVLPGIRLVIIPSSNPDGLLRGSGLEGRFNANGVDLNRNWGCDWEPTAMLQDIEVDPGPRAFSEPESLALRAFFIAEPPDAVLFYHSAAGGVFLGECGDEPAARWLGDLLEESTGYPHQASFDFYVVSGDASNWLAERGIPAAVIELYSRDDTEFEINLAGVMALQCHFAQEEQPNDALVERFCD